MISSGVIDQGLLTRIVDVIRPLCRTCYFGTRRAQSLAEGTITLIVWLLNRSNAPVNFHTQVLMRFSEMLWNSAELKKKVKIQN